MSIYPSFCLRVPVPGTAYTERESTLCHSKAHGLVEWTVTGGQGPEGKPCLGMRACGTPFFSPPKPTLHPDNACGEAGGLAWTGRADELQQREAETVRRTGWRRFLAPHSPDQGRRGPSHCSPEDTDLSGLISSCLTCADQGPSFFPPSEAWTVC